MVHAHELDGVGTLRGGLLVLRFLIELALLVAVGSAVSALGASAFGGSSLAGYALALVGVLGVIGVWASFGAPAAPYRLADPARLALELALFTLGVLALFSLGQVELAALFGLFAVATALAVRRDARIIDRR